MAKRPNKTSWTEDDLKKLERMLDGGASAVRAAAALKRGIRSVQIQAVKLGKPFLSTRAARRKMNSEPIRPNVMRQY
jgi:GcrA cell cycle regulator